MIVYFSHALPHAFLQIVKIGRLPFVAYFSGVKAAFFPHFRAFSFSL